MGTAPQKYKLGLGKKWILLDRTGFFLNIDQKRLYSVILGKNYLKVTWSVRGPYTETLKARLKHFLHNSKSNRQGMSKWFSNHSDINGTRYARLCWQNQYIHAKADLCHKTNFCWKQGCFPCHRHKPWCHAVTTKAICSCALPCAFSLCYEVIYKLLNAVLKMCYCYVALLLELKTIEVKWP